MNNYRVCLAEAVDSRDCPHLSPSLTGISFAVIKGLKVFSSCWESEVDKGRRGSQVQISVPKSLSSPYLKKKQLF